MKDPAEQLVVRQHERRECRVPVWVRIGAGDAERVILSRSAGDGSGTIPATMVDASAGGVGLESGMFLPRGVRVVVAVRLDGVLMEMPARVQRVLMNSRRPTYYLGLAFLATGAARTELADRLADALDRTAVSGAKAAGASSGDAGGRPC
jgi:hypothetical protein